MQGPDNQPYIDMVTPLNTQGPDSQPWIGANLLTHNNAQSVNHV